MTQKSLIVLFLVSIYCPKIYGQEIFENKPYEFSIQKPAKWIEADNTLIVDNLDKLELTEEQLTRLINDHKGSVMLAAFYKYNIKKHAGLIPTVQVNVRLNGTPNFEVFEEVMIQSTQSLKNVLNDFEFEVLPTSLEISGIKSVYFVGKFSLPMQNGELMKVRSRTYAIPYGAYFFQVNFTDGQENEDCTKLFDTLVQTIKIGD